MNSLDYLKPELAVLIPTCWGFGLMLKRSPINNQLIPAILCLCNVFLACLYCFSSGAENGGMDLFSGITQGGVAWLCAWLVYEKTKPKN